MRYNSFMKARRCEQCNRRYEPNAPKQKYCGGACRVAAFRNKQKQQNCFNQRIASNNTSGFKGVSWHKSHKAWQAKIVINGRAHTLGHFHNLEDAARAYDSAAVKAFGDFAHLNLPRI
jgi:hypothetical protein